MGADGLHAHGTEVVDRRPEADGLGDRRRAGLEPPGDVVRGEPVLADVEDHLAATEERRKFRQQLLPSPQHADSGGPEHLVRAEGEEVDPEGDDVGRQVGHRLGGVGHHHRAGARGPASAMSRIGLSVPSTLDMQVTPTSLAPSTRRPRSVEDEPAVVVDGYPANGQAALLGQHVPGDDVGVVLHFGEHDDIAGVQVGPPPGVGHQVEAFGGVLGEDDLPATGSGAPMNRPTLCRAASKRRVASSAMEYTPRCTLAWVVSSYSRMASSTWTGRWADEAESR